MAKLTDKSIHEIIEKRNGLSEPDRAASWRMSSLIQTFNYPLKHREEFVRYFPIAVVASLEGYFRARLSQLIDSGEPFLSNALKAYPNIVIDTTLAAAIPFCVWFHVVSERGFQIDYQGWESKIQTLSIE